jgi:hypothetical protein
MRTCSAIHHPGRPTFRVKARFRNGSCTVSRGQGAAMILVVSRPASPGLFLIHRHQPRPTIVSCCTAGSTTRRRVSTSQPSGSPDRLLSRLGIPHAGLGGGVEEHMAADRLHRAMATVFETCSSVLEGWKNAGADAYKPFASRNTEHPWIALHAWSSIRTSTKSNPTRGTHPHASVMASISVPMALALVTWRCWPSTAASSGLRATCQLHAALITTIDSALHD